MIRQILLKNDILVKLVAARTYSQPAAPAGSKGSGSPASPAAPSGDVPGLSSRCVHKKDGPVGPGAERNGTYKVPEYFSYDQTSYFEAEIEMSKFRIPQPSAKN
ncbi:uncharacterized protein LOC131288093 [Anopheles ziemanni]|uniref:uncharacterized protein LOC131258674 n=1 Tax=Anopheles coustani TaxID=139045 RepID=UPI00265841DF|nr:uncharacterized protein LOC131258674 [Anopheles coustani]XP_058173176.1 uncharacterized protein LOC131288093 [Anopheles ziemanni]